MQIVNTLSIDLRNQGFPQRIRAMQADTNTRIVELHLYDGGAAWTVPSGVTAAVGYRKPDGTAGLYDKLPDGGEALKNSGNVVTAVLAPQVLTTSGIVKTVIVLNDAQMNQLSTFPFDIFVEANPAAGKITSENYYYYTNLDAVNRAIGDISKLATVTKGSIVEAINELVINQATGGSVSLEDIKRIVERYLASNSGGSNGATFTPHVDSDGNLSWSNDKGLANPETVNIKGYSPIREKDYWTSDDIAEIKSFVNEAILGGAW